MNLDYNFMKKLFYLSAETGHLLWGEVEGWQYNPSIDLDLLYMLLGVINQDMASEVEPLLWHVHRNSERAKWLLLVLCPSEKGKF